jgi:CheY-like chemotaxis protein
VSQTYPTFGRPLVVLHVDDDPMNLRVVEEILTAFHHTSVPVGSAQEALDLVAQRPFDVILMDIHMPGMSGIQALERLRAQPSPTCDIPVVALSADVVSRHLSEYRALGFVDFIPKPILVSGLLEAVKRAAEPPPADAKTAANAA